MQQRTAVGKAIRQLLKDRAWRGSDLVRASGKKPGVVYAWLNGQVVPDTESILAITAAFNITEQQFFDLVRSSDKAPVPQGPAAAEEAPAIQRLRDKLTELARSIREAPRSQADSPLVALEVTRLERDMQNLIDLLRAMATAKAKCTRGVQDEYLERMRNIGKRMHDAERDRQRKPDRND